MWNLLEMPDSKEEDDRQRTETLAMRMEWATRSVSQPAMQIGHRLGSPRLSRCTIGSSLSVLPFAACLVFAALCRLKEPKYISALLKQAREFEAAGMGTDVVVSLFVSGEWSVCLSVELGSCVSAPGLSAVYLASWPSPTLPVSRVCLCLPSCLFAFPIAQVVTLWATWPSTPAHATPSSRALRNRRPCSR
jgi:hypothetical protein